MKAKTMRRWIVSGRKVVIGFSALLFGCFPTPLTNLAQPQNQLKSSTSTGWKSLFDGKSLTGWKASAEGYFSVEDGAITGKVERKQDGTNSRVVSSQDKEPPFPYLVWQGEKVSNFNLRFMVRLIGSIAHAGLHFRSAINAQRLAGGYQADISDFYGGLLGKRYFGEYAAAGQSNLINNEGEKIVTFFGENRELLAGVHFRDWVNYEIRVRGPQIVILLNDRKVLELIDQRNAESSPSGIIAISLHPLREMKVQLKDIELQSISPSLTDQREIAERIKAINLIEKLRVELNTGTSQSALAILKQNPQLKNALFGGLSNATSSGGMWETPLLLASARGHIEVVKWLIANGAEVNHASYNNFLPIHLAANAEIAHLLIDAGANLQALTSFNATPLQYAASSKRVDVVDAILATGYKLDIETAIRLKRADLVAKIIQSDPSTINFKPQKSKEMERRSQESPLMMAVRDEEVFITQILLNAGADVNDSYKLGGRSGPPHCGTVTPLSIAVVFRNLKLIELLLQYGANPRADCDGRSLIEYAREHRSPEIVALLEKEWPRKTK